MSDRTPCNFCSLKWIKNDYGEANIVLSDNQEHGGKDVHHKDGKFIAWFMELPDECAC
jgi:hypothetical protein